MEDLDSPEAFEVLTDETRIRILHALAEHQREHLDERALGFADRRRRVGMRDSGNFDYHLDRLRGEFVERTDEGYRLTPRGLQVVSALAAGTFHDHPSMDPFEVDVGCPNCGTEMILSYEEGLLQVACRECAGGPGISNLVAPEVVRPVAEEPLRHEVTAELGGETLTLIVDDSPAVVEATRGPTE